MAPLALEVERRTGVPAESILTSAAHESGWGRRKILNADGSDSFNLFGIKAGKSWEGARTSITTSEYVDGKRVQIVDSFRSYPDQKSAMEDFANLLKRRFPEAARATEGREYGEALQSRGYATDPNYASRIENIHRSVSRGIKDR